MRHRADGSIDGSRLPLCDAGPERPVAFHDRMVPPCGREPCGGRVCSREEHDAGRVASEPVQRARLGVTRADEPQEGALEKPARRHRRQPARFDDGDECRVLMKQPVVPRHIGLVPGRAVPHERSARAEGHVGAERPAIQREFAAEEPLAPLFARRVPMARREIRKHRHPDGIQTDPIAIGITAVDRHRLEARRSMRSIRTM